MHLSSHLWVQWRPSHWRFTSCEIGRGGSVYKWKLANITDWDSLSSLKSRLLTIYQHVTSQAVLVYRCQRSRHWWPWATSVTIYLQDGSPLPLVWSCLPYVSLLLWTSSPDFYNVSIATFKLPFPASFSFPVNQLFISLVLPLFSSSLPLYLTLFFLRTRAPMPDWLASSLTPPFTSCVTLGFMPQFHHLSSGDHSTICLTELLRWLNELIILKAPRIMPGIS